MGRETGSAFLGQAENPRYPQTPRGLEYRRGLCPFAAFRLPQVYKFGSAARGIVDTPGRQICVVSLQKTFALSLKAAGCSSAEINSTCSITRISTRRT